MDALKVILGVGGAALLYEWYTGGLSHLLGASSIPASAGAVPASSSPAVASVPASSNPMPTIAQLVNVAGAQTQNVYQWNYWYNKLTGRGVNFNMAPWPVDGSTVMDAATYLGHLQAMGLSGLGRVINLENLFRGMTPGSGFGVEEFSALSGLGLIEDSPTNSAAYIDVNPFLEAAMPNGSIHEGNVTGFLLAAQGK